MNESIELLARHGYWLPIGAVLARQACVPRPSALFLVAAGALSRSGSLVGTVGLGYILSDQLDRVAAHVVGMGTVVVLAVAAGFGFHIVRKVARWRRSVRQFKLARIRLRIGGC
jgi:membrane protein DedA with SNARE-associated domain